MVTALRRRIVAFIVGVAGCAGAAQASLFSDIVFFGDSLSDTGNVLALTTAFAPPPFPNFPAAPGRFSNGPAWVETLAAGLGHGADAAPTRLLFNGAAVVPIGAPAGNNFSYGGARTGLGGSAGPTTGILGQLIAWNGGPFAGTLTRGADPNALYVVVAGANDLRDARSANPGGSAAEDLARTAAAAGTATNVANTVGLLAQAGARHFLVATLPDLGKTPEAVGLGVVAASTDVTLKFNAALAAAMGFLDAQFLAATGQDLDIDTLDLFGLTEAVVNDALNNGGAAFGITNITAPCINPVAPGAYYFPGSTDVNCAVSLFSDPLHPSGIAHRLIGEAAILAVLPVPGSMMLVLLAGAALAAARRRRS
jgi:phospholipase/lecithinase/hemolysin